MVASARIEELTKKFEENPRRYFAPLANEYRKAGDLAQAIAICRAHLPQQPGHMSGHVVYGQALYESGQLDESRAVFETALQLDPENLIALRYLGDIARDRGEPRVAQAWYRRVLETDPRNEEIQALLRELDGMPTPASSAATAAAAVPPTAVTPPAGTGYIEAFPGTDTLPPAAGATPAMTDATPAGEIAEVVEPILTFDGTVVEPEAEPPAELPPAVIDAEGELLGLEPALEPGMAPDVARAEGLEPGSFELESFEPSGLVDTSYQATAYGADDFARLPEMEPEAVFEPTSIDALAGPGDDLTRDVTAEFAVPGLEPTAAADVDLPETDAAPPMAEAVEEPAAIPLSFDEEPGDAGPLQVDAAEEQAPDVVEPIPAVASLPPLPDEEVAVEAPAGGFVTETMAELYLRQGHREAALDVYRQLAAQHPDDQRFTARLAELERSGEPTIRSFLAGIASRRPRTAIYDGREAEAAPADEWRAEAPAVADESPVQVMGWQESTDVVAEIPLASAVDAGQLGGEVPPAVLDGIDELTPEGAPAVEAPAPDEPPARRAAPAFALDESAVPFDLPRAAAHTPPSVATTPAEPTTPIVAPVVPAEPVVAEAGSLDELLGGGRASAADTDAASTLAQAFAPDDQSAPLAGRPAVPAHDELSLDQVFREEGQEPEPQGGFSFDQFFGSRTPHAGSAAIPPGSADPASGPRRETPPASPAADVDDIEQFNSWLQGLKKR